MRRDFLPRLFTAHIVGFFAGSIDYITNRSRLCSILCPDYRVHPVGPGLSVVCLQEYGVSFWNDGATTHLLCNRCLKIIACQCCPLGLHNKGQMDYVRLNLPGLITRRGPDLRQPQLSAAGERKARNSDVIPDSHSSETTVSYLEEALGCGEPENSLMFETVDSGISVRQRPLKITI